LAREGRHDADDGRRAEGCAKGVQGQFSVGNGGGSGSSYGLYNVNERIKLYAGEAWGLASRPGAGTTITVRLRADLAEEADPPAKRRTREPSADGGKRVLRV